MSMKINVSVEELIRFADYIQCFRNEIATDCHELERATHNLAQETDEQSSAETLRMVGEITKLLENRTPELIKLEERVRAYAAFVARLRSIAGQ